jgi:hypothetical protein
MKHFFFMILGAGNKEMHNIVNRDWQSVEWIRSISSRKKGSFGVRIGSGCFHQSNQMKESQRGRRQPGANPERTAAAAHSFL